MVERFLDLFAAAYGLEWLTPKVHWLLHLGDHYTKHQILPNCFGMKGKHRLAKRNAEDLTNISRASSESLVMEVTCHHLAMLGNPSSCIFDVGLLPKRQASKKVKGILFGLLEIEYVTGIDVALQARLRPGSATMGCARKLMLSWPGQVRPAMNVQLERSCCVQVLLVWV